MLESSKNSRSKHKTSLNKINSKSSYQDFIEKDSKRIGRKKNKTMKGLKLFGNIEVKEGKKSKYSLGEIKIAKIHQQATKPLKYIKDLTKEEIKNNSCPCCGLPIKIDGKLDDYKMCDNPDEFSNCGQGVILYFSFFKFCIIVTLIATIGISFFDSFISYNYYNQLQNFCDNLSKFNNSERIKNIYNLDKCEVYSSEYLTYHKLINSFFFKVSLVNYRNYKIISEELFRKNKSKSIIINLNLINFLCLISIFIAYLVYILFIYNKSNAANYLVCSVSDYSILLTNLNDIYKKFEENLECIRNNKNNMKLDEEIYEDKLGFEPDENMPKSDLFKKFLEKKVFTEDDIKRIDLCYKLDEIINLQKEMEELDEKIERIEFDQSMIEKNKKHGIKGNKRIYYSCCSLCGIDENLEEIKKKRIVNKKKMDDLIESCRENTSEHFCGAAFVGFNYIYEQKKYLSRIQKKSCNRCMDVYITLFKIFSYFMIPYCCCCCGLCCCSCFCCCCSCCYCDKDSLNYYKRKIRCEKAPEPEDIIFENLETSYKTKIKNILCVSFVSLIISGISLGINEILYILQLNIEKSKDLNDSTIILNILSLIITIITAIMDLILEIVIEKIIKWEKSYTLTNFYATYSINLSFFWFLNSGLLPVLCDLMYKSRAEHEVLTNNMITKFLFNSFLTPIMWTMNVKFVIKKFKQCIIEQKEKISYNQKELNELYELQPMNVAVKYSYLIKTLLMSLIFAPIFPLGLGISLIGFIFAYWLEKFNFSKMYKKPEKLDKQITEYYVTYFIIIFIAYGWGSLYFLEEADIWIHIIIELFSTLLILPFNLCFQRDVLNIKKWKIHGKTYDDKYLDFITDYERTNPMTRIEGEMRYLDKLEENNRINKIEKDKIKKKIKEEDQMKFYLKRQRMSRIINIKELNNILNLDDDEQEKDSIGNIDQIIENYKNKETIFKIKKSTKYSKRKTKILKKIPSANKSKTSQSDYLMNKEKSNKSKKNKK